MRQEGAEVQPENTGGDRKECEKWSFEVGVEVGVDHS